jgi:hypothetical protein
VKIRFEISGNVTSLRASQLGKRNGMIMTLTSGIADDKNESDLMEPFCLQEWLTHFVLKRGINVLSLTAA